MTKVAWRKLVRAGSIVAHLGLASSSGSCAPAPSFSGVDISSGQSLQLVPGRMAPGHSFSGVYSSPQAGRMRLTQTGERLEGHYAYSLCGCQIQGRLSGTVQGNLAQVEVSEHFAGCGEPRELSGHGYLFYRAVPPSDAPSQLFGARAFFAPTPFDPAYHVRDEHPSTAWTAVELQPDDVVSPDDGAHCP